MEQQQHHQQHHEQSSPQEPSIVEKAMAEAGKPDADTDSAYECPFCVMMRKGGCEDVFKAFMECGEKADKGGMEMADCLPQFESLHLCMEKNKAVFDGLLQEMQTEDDGRRTAARAEADAEAAAAAVALAGSSLHSEQQQQQADAAAPSSSSGAQQQPAQQQQQSERSEQQQQQQENTAGSDSILGGRMAAAS